MSILDTALGWKLDPENQKQLTQDQAVDLVRNVLSSAAERDIYTGDCAEVCVITDEGTALREFDLKRDWAVLCPALLLASILYKTLSLTFCLPIEDSRITDDAIDSEYRAC